jgi:hypothetical protein
MPSVREYVVEQQKMLVEIHRRQPEGRWITYYFSCEDTDEIIEFQSVGLTTTLGEIYRRVKFEK